MQEENQYNIYFQNLLSYLYILLYYPCNVVMHGPI